MDPRHAIEIRGLTKTYGEVHALRGVDLQVARGTLLALLGPNGAGKTTTVRILSTLVTPSSGTAVVEGFDVVREPGRVRELIGLTGQDTSVDGILTGRENLVMMARLFHLDPAAARQRATELLQQFDLDEAADRQVRTYSGGMRRRLDLAVSLITSPAVLYLDEPTTGLDPRSRLAMWEIIKKLLVGGTTILLTTQNLEEADHLADRVVVIDGGRVVADGTAAELKRTVGTERLEFAFSTEDDTQRAQEIVGGIQLDTPAVSVSVDGPAQVRHMLNQLADAGLDVRGLALRQPSLDDVFLALTGQKVGERQ
ncbi:ATP-binding cassette domain-containing protein [Phytohabitans kaempferiae]|uniref:ATP-binding cassette domain-containing protein n=1 Tax=Phytohabitans kaempferiae TaxID=1620943 RepID=A0ABV6MFN9_9ACTN